MENKVIIDQPIAILFKFCLFILIPFIITINRYSLLQPNSKSFLIRILIIMRDHVVGQALCHKLVVLVQDERRKSIVPISASATKKRLEPRTGEGWSCFINHCSWRRRHQLLQTWSCDTKFPLPLKFWIPLTSWSRQAAKRIGRPCVVFWPRAMEGATWWYCSILDSWERKWQ